MKHIDAELHSRLKPEVGYRFYGAIFNDKKLRFVDGCPIATSTVLEVIEEQGNTFIKTKNSTYKIVS